MTDVKLFEEVFKFPSPYGVLFILIIKKFLIENNKKFVSVSLRSIIHSYIKVRTNILFFELIGFPSPYGVLFILI